MRTRWQEWVIVLGIVAIAATGVLSIWGKDIQRLFGSEPEVVLPAGEITATPG